MTFKPYTVTVACAEDGTLTVTTIDENGRLEALTGLSSLDLLATPSGFKVGLTKSPAAREAVENLMESLNAMAKPRMAMPDGKTGQYL